MWMHYGLGSFWLHLFWTLLYIYILRVEMGSLNPWSGFNFSYMRCHSAKGGLRLSCILPSRLLNAIKKNSWSQKSRQKHRNEIVICINIGLEPRFLTSWNALFPWWESNNWAQAFKKKGFCRCSRKACFYNQSARALRTGSNKSSTWMNWAVKSTEYNAT